MARKIRWLRDEGHGAPQRREIGQIESNDDDLCAAWVKAGLAEYVSEGTATTPGVGAKSVDVPPVHREIKKARKK